VGSIITGVTNEPFCEDFSKLMKAEFEMSMMGELKFFLGLQIKQTNNGIYINQAKYVKQLIKKFKLEDGKEMKTLMHPTTCLGLDEESNKVGNSQYRAMIGSLLYLTTSKPNILFSVGLCVIFQQDPKEVHLTIVKRIFRYLIGTCNFGIYFMYNREFRLISYRDTD